MAAGNFVHLLAKPIARYTPLKFDREKAVVFSRKNMNWDVRPALEATGLAENGLGFLAVVRAGAQARVPVRKVIFVNAMIPKPGETARRMVGRDRSGRSGEARQRLSDKNNVASFRDGSDHNVRIYCETGVPVIAR